MVLGHRRQSLTGMLGEVQAMYLRLHIAMNTGNRGPADDSKDYNTEDEMVVDSEQGNSA